MIDELPIAVVGSGFSGTLMAINLIRQRKRVVLIERDPARLAKGQAFGTRRPEHLLNVRAANMSAYPDDPGHFARWMGFSGTDQTNRFVPRLTYGQYLLDQLIDALAKAPEIGAVRAGEAINAEVGANSTVLRMADGDEIACSSVILALGNFPPAPLSGLERLTAPLLLDDPWREAALDSLARLDHAILVGTGLTAIDVALSLHGSGFRGKITALSRRGLWPRRHADEGPAIRPSAVPLARGSQLLRGIRQRSDQVGWHSAIDELRPHTQQLWRSHSAAEQARFLRHARAYWDVHRHRLAPAVAARIEELVATGALEFVAGKIVTANAQGGRVRLAVRPRGKDTVTHMESDVIINCTGPRNDLLRGADGLLAGLLASGLVRPDPHRVGLDVDRLGRLLGTDGRPSDSLFAVGPITKGEAWEIVAVPDIRRQVWDLARYLANAHWVGGEGL